MNHSSDPFSLSVTFNMGTGLLTTTAINLRVKVASWKYKNKSRIINEMLNWKPSQSLLRPLLALCDIRHHIRPEACQSQESWKKSSRETNKSQCFNHFSLYVMFNMDTRSFVVVYHVTVAAIGHGC